MDDEDAESGSSGSNTIALSTHIESADSVDERLLRIFDEYCQRAVERSADSSLAPSACADLFTIAICYGFGHTLYEHFDSKVERYVRELLKIRGLVTRPLKNISITLNELSEQEASFGFKKWARNFLTPYSALDESFEENRGALRIRQLQFRQRMFELREAVLCNDWPRVGSLIGSIDIIRLDPVQFTRRERWSRYYNVYARIAPFIVSIFHAGAQRLMQHNIPRDLLAKSINEFMLAVVNAQKCNETAVRARNFSLLYLCEVLAFLIANGLHEDASILVSSTSSIVAAAQMKSYMDVMKSYKALYRYEIWRWNGRPRNPNDVYPLVDDLISAIDELPVGTSSVLIYAMVDLLKSLDVTTTILEKLIDCCRRAPFMLSYAHDALINNGLQDEAEDLLTEVVIPTLKLSGSDPILLEWIQPRLLNPQSFDRSFETISHICKILFHFLDYGENRSNDRAWAFLWACVEAMSDRRMLRFYWRSRKSWWFRFHCVPLSDTGNECRLKVFQLLQKIK
ncbi:unnamed protein product [Anisakis simplex]|uniref:MYND-type domain-containing protein n=1 Tax=Anisakis simplex TaxID=6269 RepID=A0A0M3JSP6_ANISI|nr:unnamed protein product [Anisakis simplex]